jgi:hypothetical protein
MSRKHKMSGGETDPHNDKDVKAYDDEGGNIEKEAHGAYRKRGGRAKKAHGGSMIGGKPATMHLGRHRRASGGRTGADKNPLVSSAKVTPAPGIEKDS